MKSPGILEQISNTTRATINIAFWAIVAFAFLLSALMEYPRTAAIVAGICVAAIATLYGRRLVARRRLDAPLPTFEPADLPQRNNAQMQGKPPLLPVLVGVGAVAFGLVNGLFFTVWAANVLLGRPDPAPPAASLVPGLLVLMDVFTLLQIPAGVGMLLHRPWGKKLASAMALGTVITGLLGSGLGAMAVTGFPDVVFATFVWGFGTGLVWAIALGVASRCRSVKTAFGEIASHEAQDVTTP